MISIVIVHWNTPGLLDACLASIGRNAADTGLLDEVIVVDCASTDLAYLDVVRDDPRARLVQLEHNDGFATGCNAGTQVTNSEFVLFLNADTELLPGALEALRHCFCLNPLIGLVAPLLVNPDGSIQSTGYRFPGITNILFDLVQVPARIYGSRLNGRVDPGNLFHPYGIDYPLGAALAVRREALEHVEGWNESYGMYSEEIDLARRLEEGGWSRLLEPRARVVHHSGASTSQRPAEMQAALWRSRGRYHREWSSKARQLALRAVVEGATRISGDRSNAHVIRQSFRAGLAGR